MCFDRNRGASHVSLCLVFAFLHLLSTVCVADFSHALVRIRLLSVGGRDEGIDNRNRMCLRGPVTAITVETFLSDKD